MGNRIVWVDIPVADLDRAIRFYSALLGEPVTREGGPGFAFGLLPHADGEAAGCLYVPASDGNAPSAVGPLVYLDATNRLSQALEAASALGGRVLEPIQPIGGHGFRAVLLDSEGNRIALHAPAL